MGKPTECAARVPNVITYWGQSIDSPCRLPVREVESEGGDLLGWVCRRGHVTAAAPVQQPGADGLTADQRRDLMRLAKEAGFDPSKATAIEHFAFAAALKLAGHAALAVFIEERGQKVLETEFVDILPAIRDGSYFSAGKGKA